MGDVCSIIFFVRKGLLGSLVAIMCGIVMVVFQGNGIDVILWTGVEWKIRNRMKFNGNWGDFNF